MDLCLRKMASEGQVISPGTPVFQTNGAGQGNGFLRTGVSDREWALLQLAIKPRITTDAMEGKKFEATVTRKSEGTDAMNGSFTVELTLNHRDLDWPVAYLEKLPFKDHVNTPFGKFPMMLYSMAMLNPDMCL